MTNFDRTIPTLPIAGYAFWQILLVTILVSTTIGCHLVGTRRDTSFEESSGNQLACSAYAGFIDRHARRFAQHTQTYAAIEGTHYERERKASLALNFLLELQEEWDFSNPYADATDLRILLSIEETRQAGQELLINRNSDDFWRDALVLSHIDNIYISDITFDTSGPRVLRADELSFGLPIEFDEPTIGQLCLAGGFTVPNTPAFASSPNRNSLLENAADKYLGYCTLYKDAVERSYTVFSSSSTDVTMEEKHRLALLWDFLEGDRSISGALLEISRSERRLSGAWMEEVENMTSEEFAREYINSGRLEADLDDGNSSFQVTRGQLDSRLTVMTIAILRAQGDVEQYESVFREPVAAATDAAIMDMILLSSVCKDSGLPYATPHRGIV